MRPVQHLAIAGTASVFEHSRSKTVIFFKTGKMHSTCDMLLIGDGCASFMLLEALSRRPGFDTLNIVLLGAGEAMDRSWCFWEDSLPAPYSHMVECTWKEMSVLSSPLATKQSVQERPYHYLPGEAFFHYFRDTFLPCHSNIRYITEPVTDISGAPGHFTVHTAQGCYHAKEVYNSGFMPRPPQVEVWQHFHGWFVELDEPLSDPGCAVLMDFDVPQHLGCSFMYLLPLSAHTALVEYTFFGGEVWEPHVYQQVLQAYMEKRFDQAWKISRTEQGRIPMQLDVFCPVGPCGEVNIGTLGGLVKAGTGYAFRRMRMDSEALAEAWYSGRLARRAVSSRRFIWYDRLLLWIIVHHPDACKGIFARLFRGHSIVQVSRFMDEQTTLWQELRIFATLPWAIFIKAWWSIATRRAEGYRAGKPALTHA